MTKTRAFNGAALTALLAAALLAPAAAAAVSLSRVEYDGSRLRIEGSGATPNRLVTVNGGTAAGTADGSGAFRIESSNFARPADCRITVTDGVTSTTSTLPNCTPAPPPAEPLAAPAPLGPANGASVVVPFTISWSAVTHSGGIAGYNWQISTVSTFSSVTAADSTAPTVTQATISGLTAGTYFWRVQAVGGQPLQQGPWSAVRSFTVTGSSPAELPAPTLSLPHGTQFHPWESFGFAWTAVQGASLYFLEWSRSSTFPVGSTFKIDNIEKTSTGMTIGDHCGGCEQGTYFARVYALDANRVPGAKSNVVSWTISYDAPLAAPPTPLAPASGSTLTLPIELRWSDAPNPQAMGYEIEVSRNASFTDIEVHAPQLTNPRSLLLSLTAGTKFWRVRHGQGMASPTLAAFTAWSATATFTVPNQTPAVQAIWLGGPPCENPCTDRVNSGQEIEVSIQLTVAVPAGGATVTLSSSNPAASGTHPSSVSVPGGHAFTTFRLFAGSVAQPTQVTLTATLGSSSSSAVFTVFPSTLKALSFCCDTTGGFDLPGHLELTGVSPAGGTVVSLSSSSPVATPPATVTIPAGSFSMPVPIPTRNVSAPTQVTITASIGGSSVSATHTVWPQVAPSGLLLDRTSTTGQEGAWATVQIAQAPETHDVQVAVTSSHPEIARPQPYAQIGRFGVAGAVMISTQPPAVSTVVTITATGAGVTRTATLTVHPFGGPTSPTVSALSVTPSSVTGGASATGTVTLSGAAPAGGTSVALASSNTAAATVPASVTVAAGQTAASFAIASKSVTTITPVTISATSGTTASATLTVSPAAAPPPPSTDTVTITRAEYTANTRRLRVDASSSNASATLRVFVTSTNELLGTLSNGRGTFTVSTNPQNVTVRSSLGGSATRAVTPR